MTKKDTRRNVSGENKKEKKKGKKKRKEEEKEGGKLYTTVFENNERFFISISVLILIHDKYIKLVSEKMRQLQSLLKTTKINKSNVIIAYPVS